jgi:hypothetical protein
MRDILARLRMRRPYGGDTFFVSLANIFFAKADIPVNYDPHVGAVRDG